MFTRLVTTLPVVILFLPLAAPAADGKGSWESLASTAKIGQKIDITRMNSATLRGKLASIGEQSITIERRDGAQTIPREDVFRVRYVRGGHPAALGALIGAAAGAVTLWGVDRATSDKPRAGEAVGLGLVLGSGAGALAGAALPGGAILFEAPAKSIPRR